MPFVAGYPQDKLGPVAGPHKPGVQRPVCGHAEAAAHCILDQALDRPRLAVAPCQGKLGVYQGRPSSFSAQRAGAAAAGFGRRGRPELPASASGARRPVPQLCFRIAARPHRCHINTASVARSRPASRLAPRTGAMAQARSQAGRISAHQTGACRRPRAARPMCAVRHCRARPPPASAAAQRPPSGFALGRRWRDAVRPDPAQRHRSGANAVASAHGPGQAQHTVSLADANR